MDLATKYAWHVRRCFENAVWDISRVDDNILQMHGMSGNYTRHFYNNLLRLEDARYLEIGTWMGSSVCSAMCNNRATVLCIDNWSEFDGPKEQFLQYFEKYKGENDARFLESDCWKVDAHNIGKFNVYLYDGDHTEEAHYKALTHYIDALDDVFIFVVDDWNWSAVRNGTRRAMQDLGVRAVWEKEIRLTKDDNDATSYEDNRRTWWNGIFAAVCVKTK